MPKFLEKLRSKAENQEDQPKAGDQAQEALKNQALQQAGDLNEAFRIMEQFDGDKAPEKKKGLIDVLDVMAKGHLDPDSPEMKKALETGDPDSKVSAEVAHLFGLDLKRAPGKEPKTIENAENLVDIMRIANNIGEVTTDQGRTYTPEQLAKQIKLYALAASKGMDPENQLTRGEGVKELEGFREKVRAMFGHEDASTREAREHQKEIATAQKEVQVAQAYTVDDLKAAIDEVGTFRDRTAGSKKTEEFVPEYVKMRVDEAAKLWAEGKKTDAMRRLPSDGGLRRQFTSVMELSDLNNRVQTEGAKATEPGQKAFFEKIKDAGSLHEMITAARHSKKIANETGQGDVAIADNITKVANTIRNTSDPMELKRAFALVPEGSGIRAKMEHLAKLHDARQRQNSAEFKLGVVQAETIADFNRALDFAGNVRNETETARLDGQKLRDTAAQLEAAALAGDKKKISSLIARIPDEFGMRQRLKTIAADHPAKIEQIKVEKENAKGERLAIKEALRDASSLGNFMESVGKLGEKAREAIKDTKNYILGARDLAKRFPVVFEGDKLINKKLKELIGVDLDQERRIGECQSISEIIKVLGEGGSQIDQDGRVFDNEALKAYIQAVQDAAVAGDYDQDLIGLWNASSRVPTVGDRELRTQVGALLTQEYKRRHQEVENPSVEMTEDTAVDNSQPLFKQETAESEANTAEALINKAQNVVQLREAIAKAREAGADDLQFGTLDASSLEGDIDNAIDQVYLGGAEAGQQALDNLPDIVRDKVMEIVQKSPPDWMNETKAAETGAATAPETEPEPAAAPETAESADAIAQEIAEAPNYRALEEAVAKIKDLSSYATDEVIIAGNDLPTDIRKVFEASNKDANDFEEYQRRVELLPNEYGIKDKVREMLRDSAAENSMRGE